MKKFKGAIVTNEWHLEEEFSQEVNKLTNSLLTLVLWDSEKQRERSTNITWGSAQKMLGCLIGMMFEDEDIDGVADNVADCLKRSSRIWRDGAEKKLKEEENER